MGTNPCYNPSTFAPGDTPLLSTKQWQSLQLFLVDAMNLSLTPAKMPYPDVLAIYQRLHNEAISFHGATLPNAQALGNKLFNYGQNAGFAFKGVIELMGDATPDKTAIVELLQSLHSTASTYQTDSEQVFNQISAYISNTKNDVGDLQAAVKRELAKAGSDQSDLVVLKAAYDTSYADKEAAQAAILADQKVIDDTKYYSWIPFVGTAVAVGEIVAKRKDIAEQLHKISVDVAAMQKTAAQMQAKRQEIAQLNYTAQYNTHMAAEISNAMDGLGLIKSAWGTIVDELGNVISNTTKATASELKNEPCLAAVQLQTAVANWQQIAADAHSFAMNFWVKPVQAVA